MEGTRFKILQLLQSNGNQTVDALATNIGLAPATIRRHLDILQRDRFVDFREVSASQAWTPSGTIEAKPTPAGRC